MKEYTPAVVNGDLQENSTRVVSAERVPDSFLILNEALPIIPMDIGNISQALIDTLDSSLEFDSTYSQLPRSDLSLDNGFNVSQAAVDSISSYFQSQFAVYLGFSSINGYYQADARTDGSDRIRYSPNVMQVLYSSADLNATFAALARSMSNAIRAGDDHGIVQTGEIGIQYTYYRIRWGWIALHLLVVLSGTVFLLMTAFGRHGAPVWKSNALAVMGQGRRIKGLLDGADDVEEMELRAKKRNVSLFEDTECRSSTS